MCKVTSSVDETSKEIGAPNDKNVRKYKIIWLNVVLIGGINVLGVYGLYVLFAHHVMYKTMLFAYVIGWFTKLGITAGAHRLWSHKSYKATWPLRLILVIANTMAFQRSVLVWASDHRIHHKFSDTDADPYNPKRGFFFSHMGWIMVRKHRQVKEQESKLDLSDLWADPMIAFQYKYYVPLCVLLCYVLPAYIPTLWGETLWNSFLIAVALRYTYVLNVTCCINSVAHIFGNKPYDARSSSVETNALFKFIALGEAFHNFHHSFPVDYKTSELGNYTLNLTTLFIDYMAKIGWAYDLKTTSEEAIKSRVLRTGDGSHPDNDRSCVSIDNK